MKVFEPVTLLPEDVAGVEIFVRESAPHCIFVDDAKILIKKRIPEIQITEFEIKRNSAEWRKLLRERTNTRTLPQVIFIMKNGARWHFGGFPRLLEAFSMSPMTEEDLA